MAAPPGAYSGRAGSAARRAGISTAGPPARSAPGGRRSGAAAAPGPGGRSCREAGAETGGRPTCGAGVSEAWPGPGRSSWPGPPPAEGSFGEAASAPGQGRRSRHCAPPEPRTRPGEVRAPVLPIPSSSGRVGPLRSRGCCGGGRRPRTGTSTVPVRLPASRLRPTHTRARRPLPSRLPALRDVSTSCRTQHPKKPAPSARKMSARAPVGAAPPRGRVPSHSPRQGRGVRDAGTTASYRLQPSRWAWEQIRACHAPGRNPLGGGRRGSGS